MKLYDKNQVEELKAKVTDDSQTEKLPKELKEPLQFMQTKTVIYISNGRPKVEFDLSSRSDNIKEDVNAMLKELGYSSEFDGNKITIKIDRDSLTIEKYEDIYSDEASEAYVRYPLMPAYCALAVLETSRDERLTLAINETVEQITTIINHRIELAIKGEIRKDIWHDEVRLSTYNKTFPSDVGDAALINIRKFKGFFAKLKDLPNEQRRYNGMTAKIKALRAPILIRLKKELDQSGLKVEGTGWDNHVIVINL